ncbi:MAG: cell division protein FtsQ/DivIB [Candidatus Omnitrophota bacterium]
MPKRKKKIFPSWIIKSSVIVVIIIAALAACLFLFDRTASYFNESERFSVQTIVIDPTLQFIQRRDLVRLQGKNIFQIDLQDVEQGLLMKYPQISELRVEKKFPNQIHLLAKKRKRLAQFEHNNKYLVLDDEGVILSESENKDNELPSIGGPKIKIDSINPGGKVNNVEIMAGLKIIKSFNENTTLSSYKIMNMDVDQLSRILLHLDRDIKAIIDDQRINYKIKVLGIVLTQGNLNLKEVNYIDLRFKEPIIGKK